jgi:hypothetical protein
MLERRLESARTKEEAAQIVMQEMQSIAKISDADEFEKTARLNHTMDAYRKHMTGKSSEDTISLISGEMPELSSFLNPNASNPEEVDSAIFSENNEAYSSFEHFHLNKQPHPDQFFDQRHHYHHNNQKEQEVLLKKYLLRKAKSTI